MLAVLEEELIYCAGRHMGEPISVGLNRLAFGYPRSIVTKWVTHQECWDDGVAQYITTWHVSENGTRSS
jgi:hypothetical protein